MRSFGIPALNGSTFRRFERIRRSDDFVRTRRRGRRRQGRWLVVWALERPGEHPKRAARIGIQVSRKDGNAVRRNLFKRRLREVFRLNKPCAERGWDIVASPSRGAMPKDAFPASYRDLRDEFLRLLAEAQRRPQRSPQ